MSIITFSTDDAPKAIGPYSQATQGAGLVYISGQIPIDHSTGELAGDDIATQTTQVMKNLSAVLTASGVDFSKVLKCSIFLKDLSHFNTVNEIYGSYFKEPFPARACVEVSKLPKDVLVEIEAIAVAN